MFPKDYQKQIFRHRLLIFLLTTILFVAGFVLNIVMNQPLYNLNLNVVPKMQSNEGWGSKGFIIFMNVVSNVFNPVICAGYVILFFIISYRKLEILVFLVWFIFLTWCLSLIKLIFHQARPYWIEGSGVKMLEWTCYTQYGMPSGHSMMAIILLQFIIRFYSRVNHFASKYVWILYFLAICFQVCVMFSRVILGMHSFNQVLLGCMIGCYTFVPYYLFAQRFILKRVLSIFRSQRSLLTNLILISIACITLSIQILLALVINFQNSAYIAVIDLIQECDGFLVYKSFQYKCLQDSALLMAAVGILLAFNFMKKPSCLNLQLDYTRLSCRFLAKTVVTLILPVIALVIFVNPLWNMIQLDYTPKSLVIWTCQVFGFFSATFVLIYIIPLVNHRFGFQVYRIPQSYQDFRKHQVTNLIKSISFVVKKTQQKKKQSELTENSHSYTLVMNGQAQLTERAKQ